MKEAFPTIKTERLLLRQFTDNDLENVFTGLSDPNVIRYYGVSYTTLEETKLQIKYFLSWNKVIQEFGGQYAL